jgi:hypothetical protein
MTGIDVLLPGRNLPPAEMGTWSVDILSACRATTPRTPAACSSAAARARRRSAIGRRRSAAGPGGASSTRSSPPRLVEALVVLTAWGPQPVAWMWVGSQLDYATGSVFLGIVAAFFGLIGSLILTLMLATRLDHVWRLLRRAAGHDQREGVLGRIFVVTAIVAAAGFSVWFLLLEGPGSSLAPR